MLGTRNELIQQLPVLLPAGIPSEIVMGRALHLAQTWLEADCVVLTGCASCSLDIAFMGVGITHEEWGNPRYTFARTAINRVVSTRAGCLTSDAQPDEEHDIAQTIGLHSILCVPLQRRSRLLGVLYLHRRLTTAVFTPDDLDVLETIACYMTMMLP